MKYLRTFIPFCASLAALYGCAGLDGQKKLDDLNSRVATLDSSIDRTNAKIEDLDNKILLLNEKIEALKHGGAAQVQNARPLPPEGLKVVSLGQDGGSNGGQPVKNAPPAPDAAGSAAPDDRPEDMYKRAHELFNDGRYGEARAAFSKFLRSYPSSKLSNNARYWIGESYYSEGAFDKALPLFEEVAIKFPDDNKAPDCLLKAGMSYLEMSNNGKAKDTLERLLRQYPGSEAAEKAKKTLDRMSTE